VQLSDSGISSMGSEDDQSSDGSEPAANLSPKPLRVFRKRIITGNIAEEEAIMLNAPVGPDDWKDDTHLEIKGNTAKGSSFMLNYPNTQNNIAWLLKYRDQREERLWQRQNGPIRS
jgi:hypothetical protein